MKDEKGMIIAVGLTTLFIGAVVFDATMMVLGAVVFLIGAFKPKGTDKT